MTETRWWIPLPLPHPSHTHTQIIVKVFIRDRSTNMENMKTQAQHTLNGQDLTTDCRDRTKYSTIYGLVLAPLFDQNTHFSELEVGSEQENSSYFLLKGYK